MTLTMNVFQSDHEDLTEVCRQSASLARQTVQGSSCSSSSGKEVTRLIWWPPDRQTWNVLRYDQPWGMQCYNLSANDSSVLQSLTNESAVFIQFKPITGGDSVLRRKTVLAHKQSRRGWVKNEDNSNKIIIDIQVQTRVSCKCDCVNHLVSVLQNNQPQTNSQFSFRTSFSCVVATFTHLWFLFRTKWRLREYRRSFMGSWDTEQTGRGTCYR